jgi:membrane fusion protein (multidrug efflux system)
MPMFRAAMFLAVALVLAACGKQGQGDRKEAPATVTTMVVQPTRWSDELQALGTANARESVTITASVSHRPRFSE